VARLAVCLVVVAFAAQGCGGSDDPERKAPDPGPRLTAAIARELDAELQRKVTDTRVPGASAAVVFADGKQWTGAAGDAVLKPAQPMTPDTSLPFDSVTKIATAALVMRLVEQGRLELDDPIAKWYPAWRGDPEATVRDLLGHRSGTSEPPQPFWDSVSRGLRVVTAREFIAATPKPGPRTASLAYSNTGFVIAGLIARRASGEPVATAMRRELFSAPGGDGLALQPADVPHAPRAHSYFYPRGPDPVDATDGSALIPNRALAAMAPTAGSLAGDVPSLARWGHELLSGRILEPDSLREMARFVAPADRWTGYGLGLASNEIDGHLMWGHTGGGPGSHTELWHLPHERLTIAVTWNDGAIGDDGQILPALLRAALGSG
jgi:D-alanyl-D-alanine carboxypeptidase